MRTNTGQSASLMCGSPTVFRCYIRMACSLQTNRCRVHLEAARGKHSHTCFDWRVLTSLNEPKVKKKMLQPYSHALNESGLKGLVVNFLYLSHQYSLSLLSLSVCLYLHLSSSFTLFLVLFFLFLPLDQCPLCHQEMYKLRLSTPPLCVLPGAPQAHSLSMVSTRDIR